ncbi:hypothetical protein SLA2020_262850 [Shorea laevis]
MPSTRRLKIIHQLHWTRKTVTLDSNYMRLKPFIFNADNNREAGRQRTWHQAERYCLGRWRRLKGTVAWTDGKEDAGEARSPFGF